MKAVTLVLLWLLGSATAIGVAWSGVGVLNQDLAAPAPAVVPGDGEIGLVSESVNPVADDAVGTQSSDRSTLAVDGGTALTFGGQSSTSSSTAATSSTPSTAGGATTAATPSTSTRATTRTTGTTAATGTTSGGSGSSTTSATAPPASEQNETRTFTLVGGTTAIRFSPSSTKVLWATPNPGYEVRIEPESSGVKVEFRSDDHRSRIDAWWDNGPRHEIREDD